MLKQQIESYSTRIRQAKDSKATEQILAEMREAFSSSPPNVSEVVYLLNEIAEERDVPEACIVFVAASYSLSQVYVPLLCRIVLNASLSAWHELAIEVLGELAHVDSIAALKAAVGYRWDCDAFLCVPTKALEALSNIGSPEALEIITQASESSDEAVREMALDLLQA
ncbi:MAG: hypothetical protein U0894_07325 [Pirellulales bacterium]